MSLSSKRAALEIIAKMPENASLEEIMYRLFFRERVDRGLAELETGKTLEHDQVRRSVARWLQSAGR
jgi:predicted transcriptional regulator